MAIRFEKHSVTGAASYRNFAQLLSAESEAAIVAVDMPIGLPSAIGWPRAADGAARAFVGRMPTSVFVVPPINVLQAPTHSEAVRQCRDAGIPGVSQQAYALRHKILEVAPYASDLRVREVHPEVSFAAMRDSHLRYGKRTWNGYHERRRILAEAGIEVPADFGDLGRASVDDVLDATAAAWTAARISAGIGKYLPADAQGTTPRIWY